MRAFSAVAVLVLFSAFIWLQSSTPRHHFAGHQSHLLLAQSVANPPALAPGAQASSGNSRPKQNGNEARQKSAGEAQKPGTNSPGTTPWVGAPPQMPHAFPPAPLPQSGDDNDLLLIQAPQRPPKVHKA